jgi:sphingosine kinase
MPIDLLSILQSGKRSLSFMSQCVGLMADADLGTEHLRWMGSTRFMYGYLRGGELRTQIQS